jgi:vitamin B12 transporter
MKHIIQLLLFISILNANELNLDNLLDTFAKNSDLSKKTILENSGHTIVYTRDDIDRMMAKNLKDILKSYPIIGYRESRFGYPDILNMGGSLPFTSSPIRVMIDNHEITTAFNGSGFALLGDIDLGFVDHIEIYALGPSFEHSSELTYILIKLYSKKPSRDMGGKVEVNAGSYGYNFKSAYHANQLDKFSYFTYVSQTNDKKKRYDSFDTQINRDQKKEHLFASFYTKKQNLKLQIINNEKHMSLNYSHSGTPVDDLTKYKFYTINYDYDINDNLQFLASYSNGDSKSYFSDDQPYFCMDATTCMNSANIDVKEDIFSSSLKYTKKIGDNKLVIGGGVISKNFDYESLKLNGIEQTKDEYTKQTIGNIFAENQYLMDDNKIFTLGVKYNNIQNNGSINDDDIYLFRAGYTYLKNKFTSKTFIYNTTSVIEPHIIKSNFSIPDTNLEPQQMEAVSQELKFDFDNSNLNFVASFGNIKNSIYQDPTTSKITNNKKDTSMAASYIDYIYTFDKNNKVLFDISYHTSKNIPFMDNFTQYSSFVRGLNSIGKFDIYNELIYRYDNFYKNDSYDYSLGINYNYCDDLSFYIKGDNIFDKGYQDSFSRISYTSPQNFTQHQSLNISPIDRRVIIGMEYLF